MSKGIFTISLDFELFWGVRDHRTLSSYGLNISNVHKVVPRLLNLFEKYGVHCTWATVGFLFFNNKNEIVNGLPEILPDYVKPEYDPYNYIKENDLDPIYHFAPALIEKIKNTAGQEIGTHTFSHFYALEKNTTEEQFRSDLLYAVKKAKERGIEILSIVFPRNQYSSSHLQVCREAGIKIYRGNEESGIYRPVSREQESIFKRAIRLADSYVNITGHHCYPFPESADLINIPASRFLRPYSKKLKSLDSLKYKRIKSSMKYAAANGLIYHLWWHPHNFGNHIEENFNFLEKILIIYSGLNRDKQMKSLNLNEIYIETRKAQHEI